MFNKVQTVGTVQEFMTGEYKIRKEINKINKKLVKRGVTIGLATIAGVTLLDITIVKACGDVVQLANTEATPVFAGEEKLKQTILNAFDPVIELIKQLSYPIAGIMITTGSLLYMIGRTDKGIEMIQKAAIGYILVQLSDVFLKLIVGIGNSVS